MGRIIVLKVGSTYPSLVTRKGDFEDWVLAGMQIGRDRVAIVDVCSGDSLPGYKGIAGIVVTGSHAMVTTHEAWSEGVAAWLPEAVERGIPLLGICYGHQLLAYALGGQVGDNPNGYEFGTLEVHLDGNARGDGLLGDVVTSMRVHLCHAQSVLRLPPGARRLASSQNDRNQAFAVGEHAWGVQFHPEFDAEAVVAYIERFREPLLAQGQDPDRLIAECEDTVYGPRILQRFAAMMDVKRET
jgi:GMP synthase (glutamine-hydrolysing)